MRRTRTIGRRCTVIGIIHRIAHPFRQCLKHRNVNIAPFARLTPFNQRRQYIGIGIHPRRNVRDRNPRLGHRVGCACDRQKPCLGLDQQVIGLAVAIWPIRAIAGYIARDQPWVSVAQRIIRQAHAFRCTGCQVLDQHVRLGQKLMQDVQSLILFQIQTQAFFGSVDPDKMGCHPLGPRVITAGKVPNFWAFNLDHTRAQIGQLPRGKGRCDGMFQGNDSNPRQWQHLKTTLANLTNALRHKTG